MNAALKDIFERRLSPMLSNALAERLIVRKRAKKTAWLITIGWLTFVFGGVYLLSGSNPIFILTILTLVGLLVAAMLYHITLNEKSKGLDHGFVQEVGSILAEHLFDGTFENNPSEEFLPTEPLAALNGVNLPGKGQVDYGVSGRWEGVDFRMIRTVFKSSYSSENAAGRKHTTVYFTGLILKLEVPNYMPTTVVRAQPKMLDFVKRHPDKDAMQLFEQNDTAFGDTYEIWTGKNDTAIDYLETDFPQAFMRLHGAFSQYDGALSAAFIDGSFYFTIRSPKVGEKHNYLNMEDMLAPEPKGVDVYAGRIERACEELIVVRRVMGMLKIRAN